jgi:hypothetical protein
MTDGMTLRASVTISSPELAAAIGRTDGKVFRLRRCLSAAMERCCPPSRLFKRPVSVAIKGVSSGGKSFTVECVERRRLLSDQIRQIEEGRLERIEQAPVMDHTRWSDCSPELLALVSKRRTCWCARGTLAEIAGSTSRGTLCWSHWRTGRKRQQTARKRARQGGQRTSTLRNDSVGLALFAVSEGQCIGPVVSDTN